MGLYVMVVIANMTWGVTSPVLGNIQAEFGVSVIAVALLNTAFGLARLVLDIPVGLLMDRIDRRLLRLAGNTALVAGAVLCAASVNFYMMFLGALVNGVGGAIILVTNMVWITRLSTEERRGWDLGLYQALFQLGVSISPIISGVLTVLMSWRAGFWFAAGMAVLGFLPMLIGRGEWINRLPAGTKRDEQQMSAAGKPRLPATALSALFVANLVTFVLMFLVSGLQNTVIPLYGSLVLGLDAGAIGLAMGFSMMIRFAVSLIGGKLSDQFGRRAILIPGLILIGVGAIMLNFAYDLASYWWAIMVTSIGRFGNNVPATVLADHTPSNLWSVLLSVNRFVGDVGVVLGPATMGLLLESHGYGSTIAFTTAAVWISAIAVIVGVSEVRSARPVARQARV